MYNESKNKFSSIRVASNMIKSNVKSYIPDTSTKTWQSNDYDTSLEKESTSNNPNQTQSDGPVAGQRLRLLSEKNKNLANRVNKNNETNNEFNERLLNEVIFGKI